MCEWTLDFVSNISLQKSIDNGIGSSLYTEQELQVIDEVTYNRKKPVFIMCNRFLQEKMQVLL